MVFAGIQHKIRFLTLFPHQSLLQDMSHEIEQVMKRQAQHVPLSPALLRSVQMELIYLMLRNLMWLKAPLFPEVALEFLSTDYKIPRVVGQTLLSQLTEKIPLKLISTFSWDDSVYNKRFLHFIFVSCATADDEGKLVADLGMGTSLLRRIKQTAEGVLKDATASSSKVDFVPEIDAVLREVMMELAEELKVTPWAMDEYRLKFMMLDVDPSHWQAEEIELVRKTFQLLLNIGKATELPFEKLLEDYTKLFAEQDPLKAGDQLMHLLQIMKRKELVFADMASRGAPKGKWSLGQLGQQITADAFACKFLRVQQARLDRIPALNPYYQLAVMRRLSAAQLPEVLDILRTQLNKLSPKALTVAIQQLAKHATHSDIIAILKPVLEKRENPWLRAAICDGLPSLARDKSVEHLLLAMAQSDDSKRVQESAQLALAKWQDRHTEANAKM